MVQGEPDICYGSPATFERESKNAENSVER
jgi:hypothetical protein